MKSQSLDGMITTLLKVIEGDLYNIHLEECNWDGSVVKMESAYTKEGKYIGRIEDADYLMKELGLRDLQPAMPGDNVCSIGFNPEKKEWHGWSHRARFQFGIGSKVGPGDCGFRPRNVKEWLRSMLDWHECLTNPANKCFEWDANTKEFKVRNANSELILSEKLDESQLGEGEWEAKTLDDAKKMARNFAESVSSSNEFTSESNFKPRLTNKPNGRKLKIKLR